MGERNESFRPMYGGAIEYASGHVREHYGEAGYIAGVRVRLWRDSAIGRFCLGVGRESMLITADQARDLAARLLRFADMLERPAQRGRR